MPLCAKSRANIGLNIRPREIRCGYLCMLLLRKRMERNLQAVFFPTAIEMLTETFPMENGLSDANFRLLMADVK